MSYGSAIYTLANIITNRARPNYSPGSRVYVEYRDSIAHRLYAMDLPDELLDLLR